MQEMFDLVLVNTDLIVILYTCLKKMIMVLRNTYIIYQCKKI